MSQTLFFSFFRRAAAYLAAVALCLVLGAAAYSQTPTPSPTPRRPLPKPAGGSRGFEQYAGRDSSARLIAGAGTRKSDDDALVAYEYGAAAYAAGKYDRAAAEFSKATKFRPEWVQAHYALAVTLSELDQTKAIAEFKEVLKLNASDSIKVLTTYNMGNAYIDLGKYAEAVEWLRAAMVLNDELPSPIQSSPHYNLGVAYAMLGQLPEAIAEFEQTIQLKADHAEAHFNLGAAYLQLGKRQEAQEQQQQLLKLDSELAAKLEALIRK